MNSLLYLSYGEGPHNAEALYSLLTAFRFAPPPQTRFRYVVYTDEPRRFDGLGLAIVKLEQDLLRQWRGDFAYHHRITTCALIDALKRYSGSVVKVDADTYFRKSPSILFDRIGPGASVMHVPEARLGESGKDLDRTLSTIVHGAAYLDRSGSTLSFGRDEMMWNAGVIGVHVSDLPLMEEILHLIDQMLQHEAASAVHHIEQIATSYFLARNKLSSCSDVIYHYWSEDVRLPFRRRLPAILAFPPDCPLQERVDRAFKERPRASFQRRIKMNLRILLRELGFRVPGWRASA